MSVSSKVIVLGASPTPSRFSHIAVVRLLEQGYDVVPVHPQADTIHGIEVVKSLDDVEGKVDTITMYVPKSISNGLYESLCSLSPQRVLFNPGTENPDLVIKLEAKGIRTKEACTLVLLANGKF